MIPDKRSAFIFPAFINEYPESPFRGNPGLSSHFYQLLKTASGLVDPGLAEFDFETKPFLGDELRTQYITYIYSCAAARLLREKGVTPDFTAGYSMGIYAALVDSKVVTFGQGLQLIGKAWDVIGDIVGNRQFGMCSVIGLSREDIGSLVASHSLCIEITNQNSGYAFVLSGIRDDIVQFLEAATAEGALHTHLLNVTLPYHSVFLRDTEKVFADFLDEVHFAGPETKLVSLADQRILQTPEELKHEVTGNLFTPLNWFRTQSALLDRGVEMFVECGLGRNLVKNSKFIEGGYKFLDLPGFLKLKEHG